MDWNTFKEKSLPILKLNRNDYIVLHEVFFEDMNLDQLVVHDIINWLCEKPSKECLDQCIADGHKDEYDLMIDIIEESTSFEEANKASYKLFHE